MLNQSVASSNVGKTALTLAVVGMGGYLVSTTSSMDHSRFDWKNPDLQIKLTWPIQVREDVVKITYISTYVGFFYVTPTDSFKSRGGPQTSYVSL